MRKTNRRLGSFISALITAFALAGCDRIFSPTAPSWSGNSDSGGGSSEDELWAWKPCVVVQTPGFRGGPEFENQFSAVRKLQSAGRMTWIRLGGTNLRSEGRDYAQQAKTMGLHIFGIISLEDLDSMSSWNNALDIMVRTYPEVDIWEIAGEISNSDPFVNKNTSTPEIYMPKLKELYLYAKETYPRVVLTSAPTYGSVSGPAEFERFIQLGLLDLDLIIAVNIYTENALQQYSAIFDRYASKLRHKRVWVTETGINDPNRQKEWVEKFYPRIINTIRPEMICWYVMWAGDQPGGDNGFGLISGVINGDLEERPLIKSLTKGVQ